MWDPATKWRCEQDYLIRISQRNPGQTFGVAVNGATTQLLVNWCTAESPIYDDTHSPGPWLVSSHVVMVSWIIDFRSIVPMCGLRTFVVVLLRVYAFLEGRARNQLLLVWTVIFHPRGASQVSIVSHLLNRTGQIFIRS
jgi:hypothetical protein